MRFGPALAIRQDDDVDLFGADIFLGFRAQAVERRPHAAFALLRRIGDVDRDRREVVVLDGADAADALEVFVRQDRLIDFEALLLRGALELEDVRTRTDERDEAHHQLFADRVDRRVRHLREVLLEVGVQQLRLRRQRRDRRVGAHRADGFLALLRHRRQQELDALLRVAERLLQVQKRDVRLRARAAVFDGNGRSATLICVRFSHVS